MIDSRFSPLTAAAAKRIILTPEGGWTPEERWQRETEWFGEVLRHITAPWPTDCRILDYGCGIGRLAASRPRDGLHWINVDASQTMLTLGAAQVPPVIPCEWMDTEAFRHQVDRLGLRVDAAVAVWALQHIPADDLRTSIRAIHKALRPGGRFVVMNCDRRFIPAAGGAWVDDGLDVVREVNEVFGEFRSAKIRIEPTAIVADGRWLRFWEKESEHGEKVDAPRNEGGDEPAQGNGDGENDADSEDAQDGEGRPRQAEVGKVLTGAK